MVHGHKHVHRDEGIKNIKIAFFLNIGFTLFELIGGIWTNSMVILSDALHDLGDTFSLGFAWIFGKYASKTGDAKYSFGYRRFSLLGALINSLTLIGGSVFILLKAIPRLLHPQPTRAGGMLVFAVVGIIVNGIAVLRLRRGKSLNERVVTWHLLEDVLGWAAVLLVSLVLLFYKVYILDPILSIIITLYVLVNVMRNIREMFRVFLQGVPKDFDIESFEREILSLKKVQSMHHTHLWSLDGEHHVLSTHVVVDEDTTKEEIIDLKCTIKSMINGLDIFHATVEVEYENEQCMMRDMVG